MKNNIENLLIALADDMERLVRASIDRNGLWYNDYYHERKQAIKDKKEKRKIYQQIYHLERFGYLNKKGFTLKGLTKLIKARGKNNYNKKWDDRWRIVIFDIPEKKKRLRNYFRDILLGLGFKKLQNSVWISPRDNFKEIQDIIKSYKIAEYVVLMVVDKLSNDLLFKKKFNL